MSEIESVKWLRALLGVHLNWHGARLEFLARFILALLQVRTVNLSRLAVVFSSRAKVSSNYIRLQRFMREFVIDQAEIAQVVAALLPKDLPWILTLDRTNWKLGSVEINFLVLGVVYQGLAIPLFWTVRPKAGNSSTLERKALLERYWKSFRGQPVAYLLGDREFIGKDWLVYLQRRGLPFRLRLKHNHTLVSKRGESYPLLREFRRLAIGQTRLLRQPRCLWGLEVFLSAKRLGQDDWLILVSDTYSAHSLEDYAQRWSIETLFAALKSHGFHLEDTGLTDPERLERLFALLTLATLWALHVGLWAHQHQPIRQKKRFSDLSSASFATDSTSSSASSPNSTPLGPPSVRCWDSCSMDNPSRSNRIFVSCCPW